MAFIIGAIVLNFYLVFLVKYQAIKIVSKNKFDIGESYSLGSV